MSNQVETDGVADRDLIIDRIYQIALEPSSLDDFIDLWHDKDLAEALSAGEREAQGPAAPGYQSHLERAQALMQDGGGRTLDPAEYLRPYANLAAMVVNGALRVEAANPGALTAFNGKTGRALDQMRLPAEIKAALARAVRDVLRGPKSSERLLKVEASDKGGAMLLRVTRVARSLDEEPAALVVSTQFHWRDKISDLLMSVFQLTEAEQNVVRLLVEGQDAKTIAATRGTSEGTVRGQIKSIISKMNLRSQTDIVRLTMTLGEFPKGELGEVEDVVLDAPGLTSDWLETEVWKPFKSIALPDGRRLTYHEMGPPMGHPVLFSHMGSCMVRWSRSMIRMAYEHNLRVICPIRAGYGHSTRIGARVDPLKTASEDTSELLRSLGLGGMPFVAQGTDFPFAADLADRRPGLVTEVIGIGARPCLPGGRHVEGSGRWQRFFVSAAQGAPSFLRFASRAVMEMSKRIGPEAMLRQLCKDSPSDLRLLETEEIRQVLVANLSLMAGKSTNAAAAFASEYLAFQSDWSPKVASLRDRPVTLFLAEEDPTIDLSLVPKLEEAYPWIRFHIEPKAGLALAFQRYDKLIPLMAAAAKRAR